MADKKKNKKTTKKDPFEEQFKKMSKDLGSLINTKQIEELQGMLDDMIVMAQEVQEEFKEELQENPEFADMSETDISSSVSDVIQVSEDSPYLNEIFKGNDWKKVLTDLQKVDFKPPTKKDEEEKKDDSK